MLNDRQAEQLLKTLRKKYKKYKHAPTCDRIELSELADPDLHRALADHFNLSLVTIHTLSNEDLEMLTFVWISERTSDCPGSGPGNLTRREWNESRRARGILSFLE